ncbi:DUF1302 domain-containing protein [Alcanivorax sp. 1008]|uniref:DUF1302 domain-containing protein n=1 Tax=Alcanivorax sp. 1008 TaxID=2816853 RepID=UPI001D418561|nr:DUF1302 domain-containing protein [Alcanivorax sp. 1008]MCC1497177.1 DUF1302 domain-containing protein [Alcanivorax sp. 1008]
MNNKLIRKTRLAAAVAGAVMVGNLSAAEFTFNDGAITGRFDTLLSAGALFRTEGQDAKLAATEDALVMAGKGYSTQLNKNDANNNFDTGLASMVYKISPTLVMQFEGGWGINVSGTAFYDSVIMGGGHDGGDLNSIAPGFVTVGGINRYATYSDYANNGTGDRFSDDARDEAGSRARLLDAYVFADFDFLDRPMNVRLGQQVISWGEALFIQGGVNTANYIDLNALRLPGSEIKEALLPLTSLYFNWGVTDNLSMESFYQFDWQNSEDAPAGTYWSTHDAFPGKGANNVIVDGRLVAASAGVPALADAFASYTLSTYGVSGTGAGEYQYEQTQVTVNRLADEEAKDDGQFGLAFRYFSDFFGGTEFGLFYTRTHARLPVVGARLDLIGAGTIPEKIDNANYFMAYNEDVDMLGLTFSTNVGQMSLSGELAYRPEQKIINEVGDNLLQSLSGLAANPAPTIANITAHCVRLKMGGSCLDGTDAVIQGQEYYFYEEVETLTGSLVGLYFFGPMLGADNVTGVLELGVDQIISGLDSNLNYNSTAAILSGEALIRNPNDPNAYFLTESAWGYRAVLQADYTNVFAGVAIKPSVRLQHDVDGNSPIGGNFMEDRKAATLGVDFVYLNNLEVGVQATSFWGNSYSNKLSDRNNASLALKYAF